MMYMESSALGFLFHHCLLHLCLPGGEKSDGVEKVLLNLVYRLYIGVGKFLAPLQHPHGGIGIIFLHTIFHFNNHSILYSNACHELCVALAQYM